MMLLARSCEFYAKGADLLDYRIQTLEWGLTENQSQSLQFWLEAFGLVCDRGLTQVGRELCLIDPYFKKIETRQKLHWLLLRPGCVATAWWYTFYIYNRPIINKYTLTTDFYTWLQDRGKKYRYQTVKKEISTLFSMYLDSNDGVMEPKRGIENESGLEYLELIRKWGLKEVTKRGHSQKQLEMSYLLKGSSLIYNSLEPKTLLWCIKHYMVLMGQKKVSLNTLEYKAGSPGKAFGMSAFHLIDKLYSYQKEGKFNIVIASENDQVGVYLRLNQ